MTRGRHAALAVLALVLALVVPSSHHDLRTPTALSAVLDQQAPTGRLTLRAPEHLQPATPSPDALPAAPGSENQASYAAAFSPTTKTTTSSTTRRPAVRGPPIG